METIDFLLPNDPNALGVLGHLVVVNKLIHSDQVQCLEEYLAICNTSMEETCLPAILAGQDGALPFEQALDAFSAECPSVREGLYYLSAKLAYVDACLDGSEAELLHQLGQRAQLSPKRCAALSEQARQDAAAVPNDSNALFTRPYPEPVTLKSLFSRFIHWVYALFCRVFHLPVRQRPDAARYAAAIRSCAEIAKDDFSVVRPIYEQLISQCGDAIEKLEQLGRSCHTETKLSAEVADMVTAFADDLSGFVLAHSQAARSALCQTQRALSNFTISFLGRTKAGKTTLHSILTGRDRDRNMIGVGMQRTTRYNRVYQWNLLRLIDTPGIGSPEAEGRTDDEIAASILGESDIICLVIVDDSILQDILEFMKKLAALNKPIIILLNHKENIEAEVKFKRYIDHPLDWLSTTGEDNLQGHMNRIQRYAREEGFDSLLSVYPVFLLPARMAQETKYARYRKLLWDGSNIDAFIDALKSWITVSGPLKRSHTLLDGAIQNFSLAKEKILQGLGATQDKVDALKHHKLRACAHMRQCQEVLLKGAKEYLADQYHQLEAREALTFAEEHWKDAGDLSGKWNEYLTQTRFTSDIELEINRLLNGFSAELDDTVREVFEDFYFSFHATQGPLGFQNSITIDFRSFTRILGGLLDVAGGIAILFSANPLGLGLTIAGVVLHFVAEWLQPEEKKRKAKIEKLYQTLKDNIHTHAPGKIDETVTQITAQTDDLIAKIEQLFDALISELDRAIEIGNTLAQSYQQQIEFLNAVFAWRILTHLAGASEPYGPDKVSGLIAGVKREKGHMTIYSPVSVPCPADTLKNIIPETIEIVQTEV